MDIVNNPNSNEDGETFDEGFKTLHDRWNTVFEETYTVSRNGMLFNYVEDESKSFHRIILNIREG